MPAQLRKPETFGLALMAMITLLTRLPVMGHPAADFDEQLYSLIGAQMRHGMIPYIDLWDRKPVGLFLVYAMAHAIGGDGPLPYQIFALLACLIGGWQVWRLGREIVDSGTAALASSIYPALMAFYGSNSGQSEIFFLPLILAMPQCLLLAARFSPRAARLLALAAMVGGGLALQIKYTALAQCLFFGICALWMLQARQRSTPRLLADMALFGLAGIVPTALVAGWYAWHGALHDFIFANFLSIGLRAAMPLRETWFSQLVFAVPIAILAVGGIVFGRNQTPAVSRIWHLAIAWLLAALAGLFMVKTIYPYYYAALVPPAILVALPMFDRARSLGPPVLATILVGLIIVINPPACWKASRQEQRQIDRIAQEIRPHVGRKHHCLFVFDGPLALYRLTDSGLPTMYIYPDHLNGALESHALPLSLDDEVLRILDTRPGAVVTSSDAITVPNGHTVALVNQAMHDHYRYAGERHFQGRRLNVYLRNSDADGLLPPCRLR